MEDETGKQAENGREDRPISAMVGLDTAHPIWDSFFWVAPLVLIGTLGPEGEHDLAPKHMALPMGWENYFGFVCTPRHTTYHNARRSRCFTVSYPRPDQLVLTSLAAAPRSDDGSKPSLAALPVRPAEQIDGVLLAGACVELECRLHRIYDDFGINSLITGEVVAARVDERLQHSPDRDPGQMLFEHPLMAYVHPGRFAPVRETRTFPFSAGMKK